MESSGILQAIRQELSRGRTSREVIARGFAPGSVYKAQRQFRRRRGHEAAVATDGGHAVVALLEERERDRAELGRLRADMDRLQQERDVQARAHKVAEVELARERAARTKAEQECKQLRPLAVWAGHPCFVCREPLSGSVKREIAAKVLRHLAHRECIERSTTTAKAFAFLEPDLTPAE